MGCGWASTLLYILCLPLRGPGSAAEQATVPQSPQQARGAPRTASLPIPDPAALPCGASEGWCGAKGVPPPAPGVLIAASNHPLLTIMTKSSWVIYFPLISPVSAPCPICTVEHTRVKTYHPFQSADAELKSTPSSAALWQRGLQKWGDLPRDWAGHRPQLQGPEGGVSGALEVSAEGTGQGCRNKGGGAAGRREQTVGPSARQSQPPRLTHCYPSLGPSYVSRLHSFLAEPDPSAFPVRPPGTEETYLRLTP